MFDTKLFPQKMESLVPYQVDKEPYKIKLDANESFLPVPMEIRLQFCDFILQAEYNRYPDPDAEKLIAAFAAFYGIDKDGIVAGNGSDELISLIMNCFMQKGDKVLTVKPDFSMYEFYGTLSELQVVSVAKNEDFSIDFDLLSQEIERNAVKLCIFSNPCNPTGRREAKESIQTLVKKHTETIFIIDEAYMEFASEKSDAIHKQRSFLWETKNFTNVIVLKTLSKALGSAALRLGFAVGDRLTAEAFKKVKSPYNVNGISQGLGEILLCNADVMRSALSEIIDAVRYLKEKLEVFTAPDFTLLPTETNFVLVKTPRAAELQKKLAEAGISVRGFAFGGGVLRITAGSREETDQFIETLNRILERKG